MNPLSGYAWREVRRRPGRSALVFLGVAIGVAALVATSISTDVARDAYREMYGSLTGKASLEIVAEGFGGFPEDVRALVEAVPGVRAAVPVVAAPAALSAPGPRTSVILLGIDPLRDPAARDVEIVDGEPIGPVGTRRDPGGRDGSARGDGVVLLSAFARDRGIRVGSVVRLATRTGPADRTVVGLARAPSLAAFPGGVVILSLASAQRLCGFEGKLNALQIVVTESVRDGGDRGLAALEGAIAARLPAGLRVQRPAARGLVAEGTLRPVEVGLSAVSLMSLVAAIFVIWNACSMNHAERRRSLATIRAIGGTRRQVTGALLLEAGALGLLGTAVGVVVGVACARLVALGFEQTLGVPLAAPTATAGALALAFVVGPLTTLGAAVLPARRAARRDPLSDLLGSPETTDHGARRVIGRTGLALLALTLALTVGFTRGVLPSAFVAPSVALAMLGAALSFPTLLPALRSAAVTLLAPVVGAAGRLGLLQVVRRPVHTVLSSTVLFVAVMGAVGMGNEILSGVGDVRDWSRRVLTEDFFVRATMPESGTMIAASMPDALGDEIEALPDAARMNRIRFVPAIAAGLPVIAMAHTFSPRGPMDLDLDKTLDGARLRPLGRDDTILGTALALRLGLAPGDSVVLSTRVGPRRLRVVATTTEYTAGGQALYVSWETGIEAFGAGGADAYMVVAKPGRVEALGRVLASLCARDGLLLQSNADLSAAVDSKVAGVVGLLWATLAIVFLVASLGVVNTLTTNVLEQTRPIGVLRAVGTTRRQIAWMVVVQALGIAAMAVAPGAIAGIALSRLMNACTESLRGYPIEFHLSGGLVLGCAAAALLVAAASALAPAWRAARLEVTTALRYE